MPITKAAQKALRKNARQYGQNVWYKKRMKRLMREVEDLAEADKTEEAKQLLPQVYQIIDKTTKKGIIKENTASRKKSRLARLVKTEG